MSSRGGGAVGNRIAALAVAMLGMLWWLGFDKYARPLLLAFEAAVQKRPESLDDLEPEVRGAARRLYDRLLAGRKAAAQG